MLVCVGGLCLLRFRLFLVFCRFLWLLAMVYCVSLGASRRPSFSMFFALGFCLGRGVLGSALMLCSSLRFHRIFGSSPHRLVVSSCLETLRFFLYNCFSSLRASYRYIKLLLAGKAYKYYSRIVTIRSGGG